MNTKTRIEQIKKRNKWVFENFGLTPDKPMDREDCDINFLLTQLEKAREVLEFYQTEENYYPIQGSSEIDDDQGEKARALLKEWEE